MADEAKVRGGVARAEALSALERRESARKAALARWSADLLQATHQGPLQLGGVEIMAAVLPNGKRLLSQSTFLRALGRSPNPKAGTGGLATLDGLPFFLQADQLKPFISEEVRLSTTPILFRDVTGRRAVGYDAELLPMVCEVYLKFRDASLKEGKEVKALRHIVEACDRLMRGLARVGIIALVDEATGYQDLRDRLALQAILDKFLRRELAAWAKRFPDEFYQQIFRLRGWTWKGMSVNRPQAVATYTRDLVYARLAPRILNELEARNPIGERGRRRAKHHQWLTEDVGHPALAQHLYAVMGLMRISRTWDQFVTNLDVAFPKCGDTLKMPFMAEIATK
jgi:P63C domain